MSDTFLDKAYDTTGVEATRDLYSKWAASYEAEVSQNGYATPGRCGAALAAHMPDKSLPILDFGCGTGLSGLALSMAGFKVIDGMDLTQEMLDKAGEKQLYRKLTISDPNTTFPVQPGDYAAIAAIGVIGAGAAPVQVFDMLMGALGSGDKLVLSFNDHTLEDPAFEACVTEGAERGAHQVLFEEYGDHLPGINMKSKVYVLEKS